MALESQRIKLGNGIYLNLIKTDKFKSNLLSYYFIRPLEREEVTKNALLPLVLRRGTKNLPTSLQLEKKMEELYGSNLSVAINKRGEKQVIRFTMEWANGDYLGDKGYDYKVIDILREIVFSPTLEKGVFNSKYVSQEKEILKRRIESKINDKRSYAINRCIEEMCKNERYSLYQLGYVEDLEKIDESNLYRHYSKVLETSPIEIFYVGNYDENLVKYLEDSNKMDRKEIIEILEEDNIKSPMTKSIVKEELDVNQGKLVLGYRTGINYKDKLYNASVVASDILGGGPNSKLFRHVREEESLAYYITSSTYKYKCILLIDAGINFDDFDKAVDIIRKQVEDLKNGIFTQEDIDISIKSLQSSTEAIRDSIFLISEFFFSKVLSQDNRSLEEILKGFQEVTKDEIIKVANKIEIDTIYFMKNKVK
ncbi:EF-P 5-aminopentanol modification-associated protein YfmF [Wansuia hejianensis]|uniref:Insulinase family protein n=1 Tax=Wansuia hejianensis TaxID=2763667 RepID=A0A926F2C3_9FIRM|nr:pitrilysin family protein [Wansuia hejianensis]MBC8590722.1 insulinase family protein [Wansuia hejianensis]